MVGIGLVIAVAVAAAGADPPRVGSTRPHALQRAVATEWTVAGDNLGAHPRLILPFAAEVDDRGAVAGGWRFRVRPAADAPLGSHVARLRTDDGLSPPFVVALGQTPSVAEVEDNGTPATAQAIAPPVAVEGVIEGADVDHFRFTGRKGDRIVVDVLAARVGSGLDPVVRLLAADRTLIAESDDTPGLRTDARIAATLPRDGDYLVELADTRYQAPKPGPYHLVVGPLPVADEVCPIGGTIGQEATYELRGGTLGAPLVASARPTELPNEPNSVRLGLVADGFELVAPPLLASPALAEVREPADPAAPPARGSGVPAAFDGRIDPGGDEDRFVLPVQPGAALRVAVVAAERGSRLDAVLRVFKPDGGLLASADDTPIPPRNPAKAAAKKAAPLLSPDPTTTVTVPAGVTELTLSVRDLRGRGGVGYAYRVLVEPALPTVELTPGIDQVNLPHGGSSTIEVACVRRGFAGQLELTVLDPPPGITVRPGRVAANEAAGVLTITASPDAAVEVARLRLVGRGDRGGSPLVVEATRPLVFARQGEAATFELPQVGLPVATVPPTPVLLDSPAEPVATVPGLGVAVPIRATRQPGAEEVTLAFAPVSPPGGVTLAPSNLASKSGEATVTVVLAPEVPLGPFPLAIVGKGTAGGKPITVAVPLLTIDPGPPARLEVADLAGGVKLTPGGSAEVRGTVVRRGPFHDPVTVEVAGLPAGLKAEAAVVPPDRADFALKVAAEPTAPPVEATAQLKLKLQVGGKDRAVPDVPLPVRIAPNP